MAVYVRKLNNRRNIDSIRSSSTIDDTPADAITSEFKTKDNTLSIWKIQDVTSVEQGILAISLSSSYIEAMDFVLFDEDDIKEKGLRVIQTPPQKNPYSKADCMHYDISGLRLKDLSNICRLYKYTSSNYIIRKTKDELKKMINKAYSAGFVNISHASDAIRKYLSTLDTA